MHSVKNYIETSKALKEKYNEIKRGIFLHRKVLEEEFKPIIEPLREIGENFRGRIPGEDVLKRIGPLAEKYLRHRMDKSIKPDLKFGLYVDKEGNFYIGNTALIILEDELHFKNGMTFKGTVGLWELITMEKPTNYTEQDLQDYEKIVLSTNTYRHNNDANAKQVKSSTGYKYIHFIKPILQKNDIIRQTKGKKILSYPHSLADQLQMSERTNMDSLGEELGESKEGSGLRKILTNTPVEYVYWNTLDELLERLYIVYGEIKSGNNNPNLINEVVNILQEIREI